MKTYEELISQTPVFLGEWNSAEDVFYSFEYVSSWDEDADRKAALDKHKDDHILFAVYDLDDYNGDAFVLFENGGVLYEINASHCSCYGLEGQWYDEKEKVVLEELKHRLTEGWCGIYNDVEFNTALQEFLGIKTSSIESEPEPPTCTSQVANILISRTSKYFQ